MYFKKISIRNFRNYAALDLELNPHVNLFVGDNGQGKTNFLESIFLLTKGVSFRSGKTEVLINNYTKIKKTLIKARVERGPLIDEIKLEIDQNKKYFSLNEKRQSVSELIKKFPSVLFSPECLSVIKSGPEERRSLIDETLLLIQPEKAQLLADYSKALKTKNKVLRDLRDGNIESTQGNRLLESLNDQFLSLAKHLTQSRLMALKGLFPTLQSTAKQVFGDEKVDISVDYLISQQSAYDWSIDQIADALYKRSNQLKLAEIESGTSLVGPHKHDIRFIFSGVDSRYYCSQGQQRALILSFKMALVKYHYEKHGIYPVLLLDDVFSELDPERRNNLLSFLKKISSQIILTTTDISSPTGFESSEMTVFLIKHGEVQTERN